ncbi:hypothetical protein DWU98_06470 [Dyella monticola]|uniref:Tetratricopeptide repeat protein n=1 Tax=Dyella monticola TaxID=1927958 RepID=A0A370X3G9_9GAMM|nr:hypothetical protein [Dyella monticola]RDS82791.1 hypothetical protein DWU98_06470 [Dyella monticola]
MEQAFPTNNSGDCHARRLHRAAPNEMIPEKTLDALIRIGHVGRHAGLIAQSERMFEHLCHAYPLHAFPYIGIGLACVKAGRYARGSHAFEQARALGNQDRDVCLWQGICDFHCGRFADAAAIFHRLSETSFTTDNGGVKALAQSLLGVRELSAFRRQINHRQ